MQTIKYLYCENIFLSCFVFTFISRRGVYGNEDYRGVVQHCATSFVYNPTFILDKYIQTHEEI